MNIQNLNWDTSATKQSIERATEKVTGTIEKNVGKLSSDVQKNTDKVTAAVKAGSEKICDTVSKNKITNNNKTVPAKATLHQGLVSTGTALGQIGNYVSAHPKEIPAAIEGAKAMCDNLNDVLTAAATVSDSRAALVQKLTSAEQSADWVAKKFNGGAVSGNEESAPVFTGLNVPSSCGCYVGNDSFAELLQQQFGE
jgi:hypothetical protein